MISESDLSAIRALRSRLQKSILEGDVEEYVSCFTEDGAIMHPDSPQVIGRPSIAKYVAQMFEVVEVSKLDLMPVRVDGNARFAYEVGVQDCRVEPKLPGFKEVRQHLHVYEKGEDGEWLVAAAMSGNQ